MDKKELIYKTTIETFKQKGIDTDIKISEIAESAGIGKGTVYNYFDSKEELISSSLIFYMKNVILELLNKDNYQNLNLEEAFNKFTDNVLLTLRQNEFLFDFNNAERLSCHFSTEHKNKLQDKIMLMRGKYQELVSSFFKNSTYNPSHIEIDLIGVITQNMIINYSHGLSDYKKYNDSEIKKLIYDYIIKIIK